METAVRMEGVTKTFESRGKKFKAIDDLSLEIRRGEILGLLGPNGAGKTTLINILSTLIVPDSGRVEILGMDVRVSQKDVLQRINFVSGTSSFHYKETPLSLLSFYAEIYGVRDPGQKIDSLANELGIQGIMDRDYAYLSTGERTRVHIAKALLNDPELLMLDEPTLGLDPLISVKVRDLLKGINRKRGTTILLTSHYMREVEQLCDRIAFINQGRILAVGPVSALLKESNPVLKLVVELEELPQKKWIAKERFSVEDGKLVAKIVGERGVPGIIRKLVNKGLLIRSVTIEQPSLEDYFITMSKGGRP